jgi:hypothetical protein
MGLDMFAYTIKTPIPAVDFEHAPGSVEIAYWRKHPNLHGWMEQLYRSKGGTAQSFNCVPVRIDADDLDALERALDENAYRRRWASSSAKPVLKRSRLTAPSLPPHAGRSRQARSFTTTRGGDNLVASRLRP